MKGKKRRILISMDEETICLLAQQAEQNHRSRAQECYKILFDAARLGVGTEANTTDTVTEIKESDLSGSFKSDGEDVHEKGLALLEELESEGTAEPLEF